MELRKQYLLTEERLAKIDFSSLYRGFHRFPFALYDSRHACVGGEVTDRPASFLGNTSVLYNGEQTAIWQVSGEPADPDMLASKIVHEMLHAFQKASGEQRWANEQEALVRYRYDAVSLSARLREASLMRKCLTGNEPEAFSRLLSLRRARQERFPYEYDYEARIEQIEGTAHFVELSALEQLDPKKAERRWEETLTGLEKPESYFPARAVTYLSGAAFIACLRRYTDFDTDSMTGEPFAAAALRQAEPCALPAADERMTACLAGWKDRLRDTVRQILDKNDLVLEGAYRLVGWNVYDSVWDGRYALLTSFIGYIEGSELPETEEALFAQMKVIQGEAFAAEVDEHLRLTRVWRQ